MPEDDDFDNLADSFSGVTEAEWMTLLGPTNPGTGSPARSTVSTDYGDDSFIDANALAELDRIEASSLRILGSSGSASTHELSTEVQQSRYFPVARSGATSSETAVKDHESTEKRDKGSRPAKRPRSQSSTSDPEEGGSIMTMKIRRILEAYEEEITCPICCDLFVSTHSGNPCGHSYCGDCGWQWVKKNNQSQCPVCRANLVRSKPLIPNIAMDSLVEKHIAQLISAGDADWQPQGAKFTERTRRKEKWKISADARIKVKPKRVPEVRPVVVEDLPRDLIFRDVLFLPSDDDSSYVEDSGDEQGEIQATFRRVYFEAADLSALLCGVISHLLTSPPAPGSPLRAIIFAIQHTTS
ncbi:hypothetical protein NP233_g637 [Leucocoprinus birnbaumii]|uniref:RING-type domain-containing protein n=1 Tax=Leucocoprinus birnbaumii TaxID=56174 RepID=A0AAD5W1I4_9AGAR|nr:hypothetical protein NP233_g637 [Leucocoprinus birnbaumii]